MRRPVATFILSGVLAAALAAAAPAPAITLVVKPYLAPVGDLTVLCPAAAPNSLGIGGNCFALGPADDDIVVDVVNAPVGDVGFQVGFYSAGGGRLGAFRPGCNNGVFAVPNGATEARVFIDGPINGPADCGDPDNPLAGIGTRGTIGVARRP